MMIIDKLIKKKIKLYAFYLLYVIRTISYMCGGEYMSLSAVYNHTYTYAITDNHKHISKYVEVNWFLLVFVIVNCNL